MKLEKASAIAEILSSIAVLLTLIYLAIQTNQISKQTEQLTVQTEQNTAAILSGSRQEMLNAELIVLSNAMNYPPESILQGSGMTQEAYRERILYGSILRAREILWVQFNNGVIDKETWESYKATLITLLTTVPLMKESWESTTMRYVPGFVKEINEGLEEIN